MTPIEAPPSRLKLGIALAIIAYLCFSIASSLVWNCCDRFPTIQIIFIQNFVSLLCILPISLRKGLSYLKTHELPVHLMRDLFGVGSYFLYFLAIRYLNLVDAATLSNTVPFFIPFIWYFWRGEKIHSSLWWSILVGFIGVAIILQPTKQIFQLGFIYGLFAGLASALAMAALRVINLKREPMSRTLFYYFSVGTLLSLPFAWAVWVQPVEMEWIRTAGIGIATAAGQILLTIAYRYGTASYLSPLCYFTVVFNGLILYLIFGQHLVWHSWLGTILIIGSGTLTYLLRQKPKNVLESLEHPEANKKPPL